MEEELNYLSEKIEQMESDIEQTKTLIKERPNSKLLVTFLKNIEKRYKVYNNILSALTINELNK